MADIKQAAQWMLEGKRVRRPNYGPHKPTGFTDNKFIHPMLVEVIWADEHGRIRSPGDLFVSPLISALLAEDWEVVTE